MVQMCSLISFHSEVEINVISATPRSSIRRSSVNSPKTLNQIKPTSKFPADLQKNQICELLDNTGKRALLFYCYCVKIPFLTFAAKNICLPISHVGRVSNTSHVSHIIIQSKIIQSSCYTLLFYSSSKNLNSQHASKLPSISGFHNENVNMDLNGLLWNLIYADC